MTKLKSVFFALLAAAFYAINIPLSKLLLSQVGPTMMAAFLYLGAGIGIGLLALCCRQRGEKLTRQDLPYVIGMIALDIAAPILLMLGIHYGTASNASLLGNFEIVATTMIALFLLDFFDCGDAGAARGPHAVRERPLPGEGHEAPLGGDRAHHAREHSALLRGGGQLPLFRRLAVCAARRGLLGL